MKRKGIDKQKVKSGIRNREFFRGARPFLQVRYLSAIGQKAYPIRGWLIKQEVVLCG